MSTMFEFENSEENILLKLSKDFGNKSYAVLADWLVNYRFAHMLDPEFPKNYTSLWRSLVVRAKWARESRLTDFPKQKAELVAFLQEGGFREILPDHEFSKLDELLKSASITDFISYLDKFPINEEGIEKMREGYLEKLISDHEYLLSEMIEALTDQYRSRMKRTREKIEAYIEPHKKICDRTAQDLRIVTTSIQKLTIDPTIESIDRDRLLEAFRTKQKELIAILKRESDRIDSVRAFASQAKESSKAFNDFIKALQQKLEKVRQRKHYVAILTELNQEIPQLSILLDEIYSVYRSQMTELNKSFLIFDEQFQSGIIKAIEEQGTINRILFSSTGAIEIELTLATQGRKPRETGDVEDPPIGGMNYNIDLTFTEV